MREHTFSWLTPLLNGAEHANPIILSPSKDEQRATEYSKTATRGNWNEVWDNFDLRKGAKAANDASGGLSSEALAKEDEDMFARAGVAAE